MAQHYRVGRLEQEIQKEVDDILLKRVRDPRVSGLTITGVTVTGDLQQATIYYSILSDKASDGEKTATGLEKAKGLIRSELGSRLSIYKTPELIFERDTSVQYGSRIDELINNLKRQD
ncbi:30S ribosome-binding factor RbfA [Lactiplantibacillus mudanjiangensis]|uniref:Ribosome-binding factor A n=1 Tax=Lactiplantibacillus mudanjiangensis TaxID=1296538 RepID=A0A660E1Z3_9LACO|nr:30S ribosome-binding factor RbfA [Lactiplantibacillus mudanjiangensis]VDG20576.1 ribosome-binding factor A [Lactobacillus plantarum JDM1] [Lactiplantibacillus mudanjiangensis]VDG24567.1 ribosome-binding factor A [Lactobacillus plantarum JDM1] [Lactiplantibacillus mudanjiangensis]VDG28615.1 ribosome-binding factor A [Lactobacillus plantarum JDM1] [Lactiplantibacillus mudanjiangensis]VDG30686.1 ribosome-binding factor A [Lactobacillus plantarum JDM1] [Lactiplantibacillus mudanjiangensis]